MPGKRLQVAVIVATAILFLGNETLAAKFKLKNCTPVRAYVCAYKSNDSSLTIASEAGGVPAGKRRTFKCDTNRCKVFIGFSNRSLKKVLAASDGLKPAHELIGLGATFVGLTTSFGVGVAVGAAGGASLAAAGGAVAVGIGAGAVVGVAAVAVEASAKMNNVCKRIIRQVKKHKSDKAVKAGKTKGKFALSVAIDTNGNKALALTKGDSCP